MPAAFLLRKESSTMKYYYLMTARPFDLGAQPKGAELVEDFDQREEVVPNHVGWSVIAYERRLTPKEVHCYELYELPIAPQPIM